MTTLREQIENAIERVRKAERDVRSVRRSYSTPYPIIAEYADLYQAELDSAEKALSELLEKLEK
jgi:hypothetical protein